MTRCAWCSAEATSIGDAVAACVSHRACALDLEWALDAIARPWAMRAPAIGPWWRDHVAALRWGDVGDAEGWRLW